MILKKKKINIFFIFFILILFFITFSQYRDYNPKIPNYDFWWVLSSHYGESSIFKQYFFDFFNSFYLYNVEIGRDQSYYHYNHLNPFYFLSFFNLQDFSIKLSNLFALLSSAYFLYRITNILNLSLIKTYFLTLFPVLFIIFYGYFFNNSTFSSLYISLYVLFYFDLVNRSVNYSFYIFYFIVISLTSSFLLLFDFLILFLILCLFYKYKKEHKADLIFFIIANLIIWSIAVSPQILAKTELSNIYFKDFLKVIFFTIIFFGVYFFRIRILNVIKDIKFKLALQIFLILILIFLLFKDLLFFNKPGIGHLGEILNLFKFSKYNIISFFEEKNQFDLIRTVRIGSATYWYTPIALLIFTIINYQKGSRYFEIIFVSIISIISMTLILNSEFFYKFTGARLVRTQFNFIPIVLMIFIYLNLIDTLQNNKNNYLFGKNNFNRSLLLIPALTFDLFFTIHYLKTASYIYIFFLYFPFIALFFNNNNKVISFLIILFFLMTQPFMNFFLIKAQYEKGKIVNDLNQYKNFINCFKDKANYNNYDRVLATGVHHTARNYIPIMSILTERERGSDINILYSKREIEHPKLIKAYKSLLDYKYYLRSLPPAFYNSKNKKYYFEENFFDQLGINIVLVFNDKENKFKSKYKSFAYVDSCQTKLYNADIYKSKKPRGSALFLDNEGEAIKLTNLSKNSWDLSKINGLKTGKLVLTFAEHLNTKIFIDNTQVEYKKKNGKFLIPYKSGEALKIIYQNDYHRLIFILVILEYLTMLFIASNFIYSIFSRKF